MAIKLLVVDDSAFMRRIISDMIADITGVQIVGIARNGLDALEIIPRLQPDIITLDMEMPKLNGIETLKIIKEKFNIPVIMLSSNNKADITIEALEIGAIDFLEKPKDLKSNLTDFKLDLEMKIKSVFNNNDKKSESRNNELTCSKSKCKAIKAVVIGASTGGPKALVYLISRLPEDNNVPVFITQHMPKGFTTSLANRLDNESKVKVVEAHEGMVIENGVVYLAPGDFHMTLENNKIRLNTKEKLHGVRPAVDYLFDSAAQIYKENLLGIILTGMGKDGSSGMVNIKEHGGYNLAQSEKSCVVYGMPGSAVARGVVDEILSIEELSTRLNQILRVKICI